VSGQASNLSLKKLQNSEPSPAKRSRNSPTLKFTTEQGKMASSTSKVTQDQLNALESFHSYISRLHAEFKLSPLRFSSDDLNSYIDCLFSKERQ
jgi:hypothetical protein